MRNAIYNLKYFLSSIFKRKGINFALLSIISPTLISKGAGNLISGLALIFFFFLHKN